VIFYPLTLQKKIEKWLKFPADKKKVREDKKIAKAIEAELKGKKRKKV